MPIFLRQEHRKKEAAVAREKMRKTALSKLVWLIVVFVVTALALTAQQPHSVSPTDKSVLPSGPFLFEPGTVRPTYMDAFNSRPVVKSPDGKVSVTVTGPKEAYAAWIMVSRSNFPDGAIQVWPIQSSVDVLWRPDSHSFALTDRYANASYVLVCGIDFRMEDNKE